VNIVTTSVKRSLFAQLSVFFQFLCITYRAQGIVYKILVDGIIAQNNRKKEEIGLYTG